MVLFLALRNTVDMMDSDTSGEDTFRLFGYEVPELVACYFRLFDPANVPDRSGTGSYVELRLSERRIVTGDLRKSPPVRGDCRTQGSSGRRFSCSLSAS